MTDSEDGRSALSKSLPRACDNCRSRKVRCDKTVPCANCRTAGIACKITSRQNDITKPRSRVLISNQYEQKIDRMENRLETIEQLLRDLVSKPKASSTKENSPAVAFTPNGSYFTKGPTLHVEQFEGESSLTAHSKQAHEALQRLLDSAPTNIRHDPKMLNALASLQNVLQKHRSEETVPNSLHSVGKAAVQDLQYSDLPPRTEIIKLLDYVAADEMSSMFTWWLFPDIRMFYEIYDEFCQSPSDCSLSKSIIVYCSLCWLLDSNPILASENFDTTWHPAYVAACQKHLEVCISSYSLFVEPTIENVMALIASASYMIYLADISKAWTLTCTAARLCQSLGWHRFPTGQGQDTTELGIRASLFWSVYFLDKSLSLRLGRSSTFQSFDISATLMNYGDRHPQSWLHYAVLSLDMATLQGVIYDKLYSPGGIKGWSQRQSFGQNLVKQIHEMLTRNAKCFEGQGRLREYTQYYADCNEVVLHCLLTVVYRAMPPNSNADQLSLRSARSSMQAHYKCNKRLEAMGQGLRIEYMSWSIILCPFTPFIVLFRNVITELNFDDLKLLKDFVNSISWLKDNNEREPLQRFQQLCEAFYNLAKHFVDARLREDAAAQSAQGLLPELGIERMQEDATFGGPLDDSALPVDFQEWLDNHMDFLSDDWLVLGTL